MSNVIAQVASELKDLRSSNSGIELELLSNEKVLGIEKELHSVHEFSHQCFALQPRQRVCSIFDDADNGQVRLKVDDRLGHTPGTSQSHYRTILSCRYGRCD